MGEILPMREKTPINQSINQPCLPLFAAGVYTSKSIDVAVINEPKSQLYLLIRLNQSIQ